jgi:hypothetical protein
LSGIEPSQRLGRHRYVVERSLGWPVGYRRLQVRYERRADVLLGFVHPACALIAHVAIALLGASVALLVIGRGPRPQERRAEQDTGEAGQDPGTQAAASARHQQHRRKRHATSPSGRTNLQVCAARSTRSSRVRHPCEGSPSGRHGKGASMAKLALFGAAARHGRLRPTGNAGEQQQ